MGLVLAAGAGRRHGGPKGLVVGADGRPWVAARADALRVGGCREVLVVVGAAAAAVAALVPAGAVVVRAERWAQGLSASLTAGLAAAADREPPRETCTEACTETCTEACSEASAPGLRGTWAAAVVVPVDVPDLGAAEVARVLAAWPGHGLARAVHDGRPGHPVLLDRASWAVAAAGTGDEGARRLLARPGVLRVECGDLGTGRDVDVPADVPAVPPAGTAGTTGTAGW